MSRTHESNRSPVRRAMDVLRRGVDIREASRDEVKRIEALVHAEWPDAKFGRRWRWQYLQNPWRVENAPPFLVMIAKGELIGACGLMYRRLWIRGRPVTAIWLSDFNILREYRGLGYGYLLLDDVCRRSRYVFSIGAYKAMAKMLTSSRGRHIAVVTLEARATTNVASAIFPAPDYRVVPVGQFSPTLERIWCRARAAHPAISDRSVRTLHWQFCENKMLPLSIFEASRDGEVSGYMVVAEKDPDGRGYRGVVLDFLTDGTAECLLAMVRASARHLVSRGVAEMELICPSASTEKTLRSVGFCRSSFQEVLVQCQPDGGGQSDAALENWYITGGEGEVHLWE